MTSNHTSVLGLQTPSCKEVCIFLSEYAAWLLGCGATCIRIEKNVYRISDAFGFYSEMTIMPAHIHLAVWNNDRTHSYSNIRKAQKTGISFNLNTQLSKLSWEITDNKITFNEVVEHFNAIKKTKPTNPWLVLWLATFANASFCRLFGGDFWAILVVFFATLIGFRIKQFLLGKGTDVRLVFICSAFASSIIGAGAHLFGWGNTPDIALGVSVLYLIPGIPYINSVSDMLDGHYLCGVSRLIDAAVLTACLSIGLCCGLLLMNISWF